MEDPRKSDLKKLTNAISFLQKRKEWHVQQALVEEQKLQQSLASGEAAHKKIEQMGKVQDMRWLLSQDHHELRLLNDTLQTFLDMNQDMKDTQFYKAAVQYMEEQRNKWEMETAAAEVALETPSEAAPETLPEAAPETPAEAALEAPLETQLETPQ